MRIIKAAKKKDEIITTCTYCKSILGIKEVDLAWYTQRWTYECPVCATTNYFADIEKSEIFPWIMEDGNEEIPSNNSLRINSL